MDIQDPFMLLSMCNMKLRDQYSSLDELCDDMEIEKCELEEKLSSAGFEYNPDAKIYQNQAHNKSNQDMFHKFHSLTTHINH